MNNVGKTDKIIRLVLGVVLLGAAFAMYTAGAGTVAFAVTLAAGVIMVFTGTVGFCPLYLPFGIKTIKK